MSGDRGLEDPVSSVVRPDEGSGSGRNVEGDGRGGRRREGPDGRPGEGGKDLVGDVEGGGGVKEGEVVVVEATTAGEGGGED